MPTIEKKDAIRILKKDQVEKMKQALPCDFYLTYMMCRLCKNEGTFAVIYGTCINEAHCPNCNQAGLTQVQEGRVL